jgi:hypothetical protein
MSRLRELAEPFVVATPAGTSTTDRLRVTPDEAAMLAEVGGFLGGLFRTDFARRAAEGRLGSKETAVSRRDRKRALTGVSSSRWAGAITRASEDQYNLGVRALHDHRRSLRQATATIESRLAVEPGQVAVTSSGRRVRGYKNKAEWFAKTRRLNGLRHRLAQAEARAEAARPAVVHGGTRLLSKRSNLTGAGLSEQDWRDRWDASRWFLKADGETGKRYGNETIRVTPDGQVTIKIPKALAARYGTHVTLTLPLSLDTHRAGEWLDRIHANKAVGYTIRFNPGRGRWYLQVAWSCPEAEQPSLTVLAQQNTLAVDVNDQFLAAWVIDADGNPVAAHHTIPVITGNLPASTRDGHLRHAITRLIRLAQAHGCGSVTIENLNFDAARTTGRETMGRGAKGKRFRKTVAGIPTGQFRARLAGMAAEAGLSVIAVDPAYTSRWGGEHWLPNLHQPATPTQPSGPVTRHHAAAIVIGRRGKHQPARSRPVPGLPVRQRTHTDPPATRSTAHDPADASPVEPAPPPPDPTDTIQPGQAEKSTRMREPNTVRGTTEQDSLLLTSQERCALTPGAPLVASRYVLVLPSTALAGT